MSWGGWLLWGFVATIVLTTIMAASQGLRLTRMNLPYMLGTLATPDRDLAKLVGFIIHLVNGWLFSLLYVAAFSAWHRATWWLGAAIGLVHATFVLTAGMLILPGLHPRMAIRTTGAHRLSAAGTSRFPGSQLWRAYAAVGRCGTPAVRRNRGRLLPSDRDALIGQGPARPRHWAANTFGAASVPCTSSRRGARSTQQVRLGSPETATTMSARTIRCHRTATQRPRRGRTRSGHRGRRPTRSPPRQKFRSAGRPTYQTGAAPAVVGTAGNTFALSGLLRCGVYVSKLPALLEGGDVAKAGAAVRAALEPFRMFPEAEGYRMSGALDVGVCVEVCSGGVI